jgi:hypothetical protein
MKQLDRKILNKWISSMDANDAMMLLMKHTGLGVSTLQKILSNNYPSELKSIYRRGFAKALDMDEDELWRD